MTQWEQKNYPDREINIEKKMGETIDAVLEQGVSEKVYPGAVCLVAEGGRKIYLKAVGHRALTPGKLPMKVDTIFDLASLTKPLATTLALMKLIDSGALALDRPLNEIITGPIPEDKRKITPRLMLCHSAGFEAWQPFYRPVCEEPPEKRKALLRGLLLRRPLAYKPGTKSLYSDLGFMLLEWLIEHTAGESLNKYLDRHFYRPMGLTNTFLGIDSRIDSPEKFLFAATEDCPWRRRVIQGEVHDENAYAMGGYSGHSGLFATAEDVYALADMIRDHLTGSRDDYLSIETLNEFLVKQRAVPDSTWALGWDTPSPENSSAGSHFSSKSFGHLGFTGTSLWMDLEKDVIVILLTNRIHPSRDNIKIRSFRPLFHNLVMKELSLIRQVA